jgi:hypothetical protein
MQQVLKQKVNLLPGSKGWINKYMDLIEKGNISIDVQLPDTIDREAYIHAVLGKTGINFGYPSSLLFAKNVDDAKWTTEEKLKLLLLESLLFIFQLHHPDSKIDKELFAEKLLSFYGYHEAGSITRLFSFFMKESKEEKLESILADRVDIKLNLLETKFWINYIHNVFIYLDVILFYEYLSERKQSTIYHYDDQALNALNTIAMASSSDGIIEAKERIMFKVFLASANISDKHRTVAEKRFEKGGSFSDFNEQINKSKLAKRFLLDLAALVICSNHEAVSEEKQFLSDLSVHLGFGEAELNESLLLTEQFIIDNHEKVPFLSDSSAVEKVYSSLSKRWIKILGRNKDKLAAELKQSKELVYLIRKSATTELSKQEKELVKEQFKDIVKTMPSLAIFMLPGGALLLPLVLKVIPDLVPSAFRDNKLEE